MRILCLLLLSLSAFAQKTEKFSFNFEKFIEDPRKLHGTTITIKGEIRDVKLTTVNDDFSFYTFKLFPYKKGDHKNKFFGITIFNTSAGETIDEREFVENEEDVEVKGRFVRPYDEIEIHRKELGHIYVNDEQYQKDFKAAKEDKPKIGNTIINESNKGFHEISIGDVASDFAEESGKLIKSTGYINDIKYTQLITGDMYFQIVVRDQLDEKNKAPFVLLKYYNYIQGIPVSEQDLSQFLFVGQKIDFKGEYIYKEKGENGALIGEVILNKFTPDGSYYDYLFQE